MSPNFMSLFANQFQLNLTQLMQENIEFETPRRQLQIQYRKLVQLFESMEKENSSFNVSYDELNAYIHAFPRKDKQAALTRQLNQVERLFDTTNAS